MSKVYSEKYIHRPNKGGGVQKMTNMRYDLDWGFGPRVRGSLELGKWQTGDLQPVVCVEKTGYCEMAYMQCSIWSIEL